MATETLELEGTWEEILAHRDELRGTRVRLTAWRFSDAATVSGENHRMLAWLDDLQQNPWTPEETTILEGLHEYRRQNQLQFRKPEDLS